MMDRDSRPRPIRTWCNNVRFLATNANNMIFENTTSLWSVMPEVGEPAVGHVLLR